MRRRRLSLLTHYPFWVLIAAWFCANTPHEAYWHALLWIKDARQFSHQAQLQSRVMAMISGQPSAQTLHRVALNETSPQPETTAPPADASLKKIPLSFETDPALAAPRAAEARWTDFAWAPLRAPIIDVPHPPPRV